MCTTVVHNKVVIINQTLSKHVSALKHRQPDNLSKLAPERSTILDFTGVRDDRVAMASAGPYANHLHLTPDR